MMDAYVIYVHVNPLMESGKKNKNVSNGIRPKIRVYGTSAMTCVMVSKKKHNHEYKGSNRVILIPFQSGP